MVFIFFKALFLCNKGLPNFTPVIQICSFGGHLGARLNGNCLHHHQVPQVLLRFNFVYFDFAVLSQLISVNT